MEQFGLCQQYRKAVEAGTDPRRGAVRDRAQRPPRRRGAQPAVPADAWDDRHRPDRPEPTTSWCSTTRSAGETARRVPRARTRCRAGPRTPRRRAGNVADRADDPLARPRHLPEGGEEGGGHRSRRSSTPRFCGATPTARCCPASRSTRSSRRPTARIRPRSSPALRLRHGLHLAWSKVARDDEAAEQFLQPLRARTGRPGRLSRRRRRRQAAAGPRHGGAGMTAASDARADWRTSPPADDYTSMS